MKTSPFVMPPVELPVSRGCPSTKRKLGLVEQWKKMSAAAKKARGDVYQGAAAGDDFFFHHKVCSTAISVKQTPISVMEVGVL